MSLQEQLIARLQELGYTVATNLAEGREEERIWVREKFEITTLSYLPRYVGIFSRPQIDLVGVSEVSSQFYHFVNTSIGNPPDEGGGEIQIAWEAIKTGVKMAQVGTGVVAKERRDLQAFWAIPIIFTDSVSDELASILAKTTVDHRGRVEFPVVVDESTGRAHHFNLRKIFGGLYFWKIRHEVARFFPPSQSPPVPEFPPVPQETTSPEDIPATPSEPEIDPDELPPLSPE